ncbi:MAG: hypothetical protein QOK06_1592 [Acidimicrobiaceae bacterium]
MKLAGFALGLVAVLGIGAAVGAAIGPSPATATDETPEALGAGVVSAESGYRMMALSNLAKDGGAFRFVIVGRDGNPVGRFTPVHERDLHLIVVNRELTDYHHVHPTLGADGTWSIDLPALAAGSYRAIADFRVKDGPRHALGVDLGVPGSYQPIEPPGPASSVVVDGYEVTLQGQQSDGGADTLALSVRQDGRLVTDLEQYLGADGHLVAMRAGDLAYSHVHPLGSRHDGTVRFEATLPSAGRYRLFFDFQHAGTVRTAAFTYEQGLVTGAVPVMSH